MSRPRASRALVALLLSCARPLSAQVSEEGQQAPASGPEESRLPARERAERARELGHRGLAAFSEGRFEDAVSLFEQAESWMHSPVFLLHGARAHIELGQLESARDLLRTVYAEPLAEDAPTAWHEARRSAEAELAALPHEAPAPAAPPALSPDAPSPSQASESTPPASLRRPRATPPLNGPEEPPYRRGAYAAFGVGAAGLLVGVVAGGMAFSRAADLKSRCVDSVCRAEDEPLAQEARRLAHVATTGFVMTAVGALTGVTLWLLPQQSTGLAVVVSPSHATLRGTF